MVALSENIKMLITVGCGDCKRTHTEVCDLFYELYPN